MGNKAAIKHIEFWVSNFKRSVKFYKGVLEIIGWSHIEKNAFSDGQTKIYFVEQDVKLQKTIGPRHICFLANSRAEVNSVGKFLDKNSYNIIRGPLNYHYKNKNSYTVDFRDPDGYVIEVATKSVALRK
jgi:catechol 2,3-dioxygenase-like lactoylglutathione lyase family enzyme